MKLFNQSLSETYKILNSKEKKKIFFIFFLILFGMVLEMFGIGILVPAITFISKDNYLDNLNINFLKLYSREQIVIIGVGLYIVFYFLKTFFMSYLIWKQQKFLATITVRISSLLFKNYLYSSSSSAASCTKS